MASRLLPTPFSQAQAREQMQMRATDRTLSARTVIIIFVVLLILFGWLHLILALETASTGYQIQRKMEELKKIERDNQDLQMEIAEILSATKMVPRAESLGYGPQQPIYLQASQSTAQP